MTGATAEQPRAVGDAGPNGGINESTPVLGGAPMRAVGDAGPYGVRLSGCAGIRETADMGATVPLHDNRPARLRAVRGSGSDKRSTRDSLYGDQHIFWFSRGTRRRFMTQSAAQEVLKPAVSSSIFGHFWGCGQK